jgi:hypothetical protein
MIKLFSHRGLHDENNPQNSIASLKNAYAKNFRAIEFDIWFWHERLLIAHDCPKDNASNQLPQLKDYFLYKNELEYWMDFKNLDENNAEGALSLVKKTIDEFAIDLDRIFFVPFITDYKKAEKILVLVRKIFGDKARFGAVCEDIKSFEQVIDFIRKNEIKYLSINHELLIEKNLQRLSQIEIMAWTIKNKKRFEELKEWGVRSFATDVEL